MMEKELTVPHLFDGLTCPSGSNLVFFLRWQVGQVFSQGRSLLEFLSILIESGQWIKV